VKATLSSESPEVLSPAQPRMRLWSASDRRHPTASEKIVNLTVLPHFLLRQSLRRKQARPEEFWSSSTIHRSF
jgi:hypothetical protein